MENQAKYFTVGFFVIAVTIGILMTAIWLGKINISQDTRGYAIDFRTSVSGIDKGTKVSYHGVQVGKVEKLEIKPDDPETVRVIISIKKDLVIKKDVRAIVEIKGFAGSKFIQLEGGTRESPALVAEKGEAYPLISADLSSIEESISSIPKLIGKITGVVDQVRGFTSIENQKNFSAIIANFEKVSTMLAKRTEDVDRTIKNITAFSDDMSGIGSDAKKLVQTITKGADLFVGDATKAFTTIDDAAKEFHSLIKENRVPIKDFTTSGLHEVTRLMNDFRDLTLSFNRVLTRLESNPVGFLFGKSSQGVKPE